MNTPTDNCSQPNSLDLDYDMWAGLFEFVGPTPSDSNGNSLNNSQHSNQTQSTLNNSSHGGYQLKFGLDKHEASQNQQNNNHNNGISCSLEHHGSTESLEDLNLSFYTHQQSQQQHRPLNSLNSSAYSFGGGSYASGSDTTTTTPDYQENSRTIRSELSSSIRPILLHDQEQFLSLNPGDFDDIVPSPSGPSSLIFIENNLDANDVNRSAPDDANNNNNNNHSNNSKLISYESLTQKFNKSKTNNNNTNGFKLENLKNFKNKLICDFESEKLGGGCGDVPPFVSECVYSSEPQGGSPNKLHGVLSAELCDNLNEQLELLQRQVTDLADTQNIAEDRTVRTKTEYAVLQARYHMLEEQFRESELRAEERLAEEQKRYRELLARVEREAELQNENCQFKIKTIELEANALREEQQRLRILCDKQANDLHRTEEKLELANDQIALLQQDLDEAKRKERSYEREKESTEGLMLELGKELERLRAETGPAMPTTSPEAIRLEELHQELEEMRQKVRMLEEQNEELQAQVLTRGVEEGRQLLNGTLNSLAQELEEMSLAQDSVDSGTLASLSQLQQAFQEKEEECTRLKKYIDTIILSIVETYPQLLEIKEKK